MIYTDAVLDLLILFDCICDERIVNCKTFALTSLLIWISFAILVCVFSVKLIIVPTSTFERGQRTLGSCGMAQNILKLVRKVF